MKFANIILFGLLCGLLPVMLAFRFLELTDTPDKIPDHVKSFCQAQFEVYGIEYNSCIESYNKRR